MIPGGITTRSLTDARGKTSSVEKEYWIGAVKKITHGDGTYVSFAYTDDANPHYLLSKTDQRGKVTSYTRYPANHPNQAHDPADRLPRLADGNLSSTTTLGRCSSTA